MFCVLVARDGLQPSLPTGKQGLNLSSLAIPPSSHNKLFRV